MKMKRTLFLLFAFLFFLCGVSVSRPIHSRADSSVPTPDFLDCDAMAYNAVGVLVEYDEPEYYTCEVYRSTSKNGSYKRVGTIKTSGVTWYTSNGSTYSLDAKKRAKCFRSGDQFIFVDYSAAFNKTYYYKVRLKDGSGTAGSFSKVLSGKAKLNAVEINSVYTASNSKVKLSWNKVSGAQGYVIYRKYGGKWKAIKRVSKNTTSYTDRSVKSGKTYGYRIRAYRKSGSKRILGPQGTIFRVTTKAPTVKGSYKAGSVYGPSLSTSELTEVRRVVQSFKANYIKSGMSDYEKVKAAHDYLCYNCTYAYNGWQYNGANTAWGALVYGEAQCSGYSRAMKALCDAMGIPCYYVHANSKSANPSHQWNQVKVDGKWYIVDVQGDDSGDIFGMGISYNYFLVSAKSYKAMTGMQWNTAGLPACKTNYTGK